MEKYDAAVIGGGLLGCFAARELCRYTLSVALVEAREDVCTGISKANSAIIYSGCDNKAGSLKARLTVKANASFAALAAELDVPFSRCGSLIVSYGGEADAVLARKLENGRENGVPALRLISGGEAQALEPLLAKGVSSALYAESSGVADPWQLCYGAYENALYNGCTPMLNTKLLSIKRERGGYILETDRGEIRTRAVINCAGMHADKVHEMLFPPKVRIVPSAADYLVLDRLAQGTNHIIMHQRLSGKKGLTAVPTVGGNMLLGFGEREIAGECSATDGGGLDALRRLTAEVLPTLDMGSVIRSFAALRPDPYELTLENGSLRPGSAAIGSFVIETPQPDFISFIGIKTPGLTCAHELGKLAAEKLAESLHASCRSDFQPCRKAIESLRSLPFERRRALVEADGDRGSILCRCEDISKAEVLEAIKRGAVTVDGVKRRCGALMGACQGSRCQNEIAALLAEKLGVPESSVTSSGGSSFLTEV